MSQRITGYRIVVSEELTSEYLESLESQIRGLLSNGWVPLGPILCEADCYAQAMVRYAPRMTCNPETDSVSELEAVQAWAQNPERRVFRIDTPIDAQTPTICSYDNQTMHADQRVLLVMLQRHQAVLVDLGSVQCRCVITESSPFHRAELGWQVVRKGKSNAMDGS